MPLDYRAVIADESSRFAAALRDVDLQSSVPSCPDWAVADLLHHLADVQYFWAAIVRDLLTDPEEVQELSRPNDDQLLEVVEAQTAALLDALDRRRPEDACWSWHDDGHTVGWTLRRQAHEALVHRVDAELAADRAVTAPEVELATDCVDELVMVFLDGVPDWGTFTPGTEVVRMHALDADATWTMRFGRFTGTSPNTGRTYDLDAIRVEPDAAPGATIRGTAWDLAMWAWGRGDLGRLTVEGDPELAARLRALIADDTQ